MEIILAALGTAFPVAAVAGRYALKASKAAKTAVEVAEMQPDEARKHLINRKIN